MAIPDTVFGCKLLASDGGSINSEHGRVLYPLGEWIDVPGNGAYIAVTGGLLAGGVGPLLAYFECREPTGAAATAGVVCFRRVRLLNDPCKVDARLMGEIACYMPGLSPEQRLALAADSTPYWRGEIARYAPGLSSEQRIALAAYSTPYWRGKIARYAPGLSRKQRLALEGDSTS